MLVWFQGRSVEKKNEGKEEGRREVRGVGTEMEGWW